jgi:chromosome segregation ATPase
VVVSDGRLSAEHSWEVTIVNVADLRARHGELLALYLNATNVTFTSVSDVRGALENWSAELESVAQELALAGFAELSENVSRMREELLVLLANLTNLTSELANLSASYSGALNRTEEAEAAAEQAEQERRQAQEDKKRVLRELRALEAQRVYLVVLSLLCGMLAGIALACFFVRRRK